MLTGKIGATILGLLVGGALLVGVLGTATTMRSQGWSDTNAQGNGIGGMMGDQSYGQNGSGGMMNQQEGGGYNGTGGMMGGR